MDHEAFFFVGCLLGFALGIVCADSLWRANIKAKAKSGIRLESWGSLYNVTADSAGDGNAD